MDAFYTYQPKLVDRNLTRVVKEALGSKDAFGNNWSSVPQTLPHSVLTIAPGQAIYFIGKLDSLIDQLGAIEGRGRIETTDGAGLSIATVNNITLSGTTQFGAFFKAKVSGKQSTIDLNKLRQKKLTIVAVFHADTDGRPEPDVHKILNLINKELPYAALANRLSNMRATAIVKVRGEREQAVGNLFTSLNM